MIPAQAAKMRCCVMLQLQCGVHMSISTVGTGGRSAGGPRAGGRRPLQPLPNAWSPRCAARRAPSTVHGGRARCGILHGTPNTPRERAPTCLAASDRRRTRLNTHGVHNEPMTTKDQNASVRLPDNLTEPWTISTMAALAPYGWVGASAARAVALAIESTL